MKNLLLILSLSIFLSFYGINYSRAQEAYKSTENSLDYKCVKVKLSENSKWSIMTTEDGWHVKTFAKYAGVTPIISNRKYSRSSVAFLNSSKLEQSASKLNKNNDRIIDLDELFDIY